MNKYFILLISVAVLAGLFLTYRASQTTTSLVFKPSELIEKIRSSGSDDSSLQRLRVAGRVAAMEIDYQVKPALKLEFTIHDPEAGEERLPVIYRGVKPDMFAPGRDVIIDGSYVDGKLVASNLLTQCPSKYEPPTPDGNGDAQKQGVTDE